MSYEEPCWFDRTDSCGELLLERGIVFANVATVCQPHPRRCALRNGAWTILTARGLVRNLVAMLWNRVIRAWSSLSVNDRSTTRLASSDAHGDHASTCARPGSRIGPLVNLPHSRMF